MNEDNKAPMVHLPDATIALGAQVGNPVLVQQLNQIGPMWQQAFQVVQKKSPQAPLDPAIAKTFEAAMAEIQRKTQVDQADAQRNMQELQLKAQQFQLAAQDQQFTQQQTVQMLQAELQKQAQEFQASMAETQRKTQEFMQDLQQRRADAENKMQVDMGNLHVKMLELESKNQALQEAATKNEREFMLKLEEVENREVPMPDFAPHLKQMGDMLGQLKEAKTNDGIGHVMNGLQQVMEHMNAPTEIIRDQNGRPVGMRKVAQSVQVIGG